MENTEMIPAAFAVAISNFGAVFTGLLITKNLKKPGINIIKLPSYHPPPEAFPPISIYLYSTIGYASFLVWRDGNGFSGVARVPLIFYIIQLLTYWIYRISFYEMGYFQCVSLRLYLFEV